MTRGSNGRNDTLLGGRNDKMLSVAPMTRCSEVLMTCGSNRRNAMANGLNVSNPYNTLNIIYNF